LDISDNIQSSKNSDEEDDDNGGSCSQSVNSQYSDEDDNNNMTRNLSQRSMNSTGGGHYVQVNLIPSNAPARRPRSRSRSTNGSSADVNNSERSGIEIYTEGSSHGRLSDSTSSFQENSSADVVAAAIAAVSAACDNEQSQHHHHHHHHHHPRYERIDSRSNSEIEADNVQLSGERESHKFSGAMKRQSRMNYTAKKQHSLRDSAIKVMSLRRISNRSLNPDDDDSGDVQDGVGLEPNKEVLELWREVADDLDGGEFDFSCCLYTM
jgi:hypothetical protein